MTKTPDFYRGYTITHNVNAPVTGRYRGVRFGVGLGADSWEALKRMIDVRIHEAQNRGPISSPSGYAIP